MAEKKGVGHAYNVDFLNVVFAASQRVPVSVRRLDGLGRLRPGLEEHAAPVCAARIRGDAGAAAAGEPRGRSQPAAAASGAAAGDEREGRGQPAEGRRAAGANRGRRQPAVPRHNRLPDGEGDVGSGPLRLRGVARSPRIRRGGEGPGGGRTGAARRRAEPRSREDHGGKGGAAGGARQVHRRGRGHREGDCRADRRGNPSAESARRHRAERREGLLPQRAAPRLHGADAEDSAGHPAQCRRRCELHPRAEDGSMPDVPSGDRPGGLRKVPAAVHHASEPRSVRRQRVAASDREDRLHRLPRGHGTVRQLRRCGAHAGDRAAERGVGGDLSLGRAASVGLPDAADEPDRGLVREVSQAGDLSSQRGQADQRLRHVRAGRLLRVPQDEGLRRRT